jgi:uncharacterized protein (TIGR03086 family)
MEQDVALQRAGEVATAVVSAITDDQHGLPTACSEWNVRDVLNHLVAGNLATVAVVAAQAPPDRSADHLGGDPKAAFAASLTRARGALGAQGVAERVMVTPFGEQPGRVLATMRIAELFLHSWDLADATGQSRDLDPELAEYVRQQWTELLGDRSRTALPFGEPVEVAERASTADRLAAYLGRTPVLAD